MGGNLPPSPALIRRITPELPHMTRHLPQYLIFLGAHVLLVAAVIALN
jgi:hypothetical protein